MECKFIEYGKYKLYSVFGCKGKWTYEILESELNFREFRF